MICNQMGAFLQEDVVKQKHMTAFRIDCLNYVHRLRLMRII